MFLLCFVLLAVIALCIVVMAFHITSFSQAFKDIIALVEDMTRKLESKKAEAVAPAAKESEAVTAPTVAPTAPTEPNTPATAPTEVKPAEAAPTIPAKPVETPVAEEAEVVGRQVNDERVREKRREQDERGKKRQDFL